MTSFFEHQRSSFKRNYLRTLIALASSDGHLDEEEKKLIHTIGIRRGLKEWQVNELLEETVMREVFIPEGIGNRMNLLYDVMQMVYADGKVTESEVEFITRMVEALKFDASMVKDLLNLFESRTPSGTEWNEFIESVSTLSH